MAYKTLDPMNVNTPVTSTYLNQIKDNFDFIAANSPMAAFDSDWFAVALNTAYSHNHGLGTEPRLVMVLFRPDLNPGSAERALYTGVEGANVRQPDIRWTDTAIVVETGSTNIIATATMTATSGYCRILAWL